MRIRGNANNSFCSPRYLNANNRLANPWFNNGCAAKFERNKLNYVYFVPRNGKYSRQGNIKRLSANHEFATPLDLIMNVTKELIQQAIVNAAINHKRKKAVIKMLADIDSYSTNLLQYFKNNKFEGFTPKYKHLTKVNTNGKHRDIYSPSLKTRVLQHLFIILIKPYYDVTDQHISYNCKENHGIFAKDKSKSLFHRVQHIIYERKDLHYALLIDQRKCYQHITRKLFRKQLKRITNDSDLIEFGIDITFNGNIFPIGTPTSPLAHHIILSDFDKFVNSMSPIVVRYADDCLLTFHTKEEANRAKWRIKNFWWYNLNIRAKRHTTRVQPLKEVSMCGLIFHRVYNEHCKGYVTIRKNIKKRAYHCSNDNSWSSYFGIFKRTDSFRTMETIENKMDLKQLTKRIKIERKLDAKIIDIKEVLEKEFTILDFEIREGKENRNDWIKMLIAMPGNDRKDPCFAIQGSYQFLSEFLKKCSSEFGKGEMLPITNAYIVENSGFIFKNSTNLIKYMKDFKYGE